MNKIEEIRLRSCVCEQVKEWAGYYNVSEDEIWDALRDFAEYRVSLRVSELANADKVSVGDSLWHDGSEKPKTGRIMFESTEGGLRFADYSLEHNRFDCDDECYYSGTWKRCHIKRWMYEQDLLEL